MSLLDEKVLDIEAAESESVSEDLQTRPLPEESCIQRVQGRIVTGIPSPTTGLRKDYLTEQYYSVSSPKGPPGGLVVKRYKLEKDHSRHRGKVNRSKFESLSDSLKTKLTSAGNSLLSSSSFINVQNKSEPEIDSNDNYSSVNEQNNIAKTNKTAVSRKPVCSTETPITFNRSRITNNLGSNCSRGVNKSGYSKTPVVLDTSVKPLIITDNWTRQSPRQQAENFKSDPTHRANMSESILAEPRLHEKQELQTLNARLSQYIRHIREMKENSGYLDSQVGNALWNYVVVII